MTNCLTYRERLALALVPITLRVRSLLGLRGRVRVEAERHNRRVAARRWWLGSAERRTELVRRLGGAGALARWERRAERLARIAKVGEERVEPTAETGTSSVALPQFVPEVSRFVPMDSAFVPQSHGFVPEAVKFVPDFDAYLDAVEAGLEAAIATDDGSALERAIARLEDADVRAGLCRAEDVRCEDAEPCVRFRLAGLPQSASARRRMGRPGKPKAAEARHDAGARDIWVSVWPSELREEEAEAAHRERRGRVIGELLGSAAEFLAPRSQTQGGLTDLPRPDT